MEEPASKKTKVSNVNADVKHSMEDLYVLRYKVDEIHSKSVNALRISPDGNLIATASSDSTVKIFRLASGELVTILKGHSKGVSDIAFSPIDSNIIASASDDMTIKLWSISNSSCIRTLSRHTYHVTTIKFNYKGNMLISGSADENVIIWDIVTGVPQKTLAAHSDPVSSLVLTPDSTIIVSASYDGLMRLFDAETGQCLKTLTYNSTSHGTATASTNDVVNFPICHVAISPNGKYILSSGLDGVMRLWDYMNNKVVKTYRGLNNGDVPINEKYSCDTAFLTATKRPMIISGTDSCGVLVWEVQSRNIVYQYKISDGPILALEITDEGKTLIICDTHGTLSILDLNKKYYANPVIEE